MPQAIEEAETSQHSPCDSPFPCGLLHGGWVFAVHRCVVQVTALVERPVLLLPKVRRFRASPRCRVHRLCPQLRHCLQHHHWTWKACLPLKQHRSLLPVVLDDWGLRAIIHVIASEGIASPGVWTPFAVEATVKLSEVQPPADLQPDYMQAARLPADAFSRAFDCRCQSTNHGSRARCMSSSKIDMQVSSWGRVVQESRKRHSRAAARPLFCLFCRLSACFMSCFGCLLLYLLGQKALLKVWMTSRDGSQDRRVIIIGGYK